MNPSDLFDLIAKRRSIFPRQYNEKPISTKTIMDILAQANWAPTHKRTEPWRFKVLRADALHRLADLAQQHYKETTEPEKFDEDKMIKKGLKPLQSACVIAICMQRDPMESLPEWEEVASVACAVQNMWLACTALSIGSYWSSPALIGAKKFESFIKLNDGEKCLGLFYMGYFDEAPQAGKRSPIAEKVKWIND